MIVGHTGCGMTIFSEEEFENHIHTQCGVWAVSPHKFHCYTDVNLATKKQVLKLRCDATAKVTVSLRLRHRRMAKECRAGNGACYKMWAARWARNCDEDAFDEISRIQIRRRLIDGVNTGFPSFIPGGR